MNGNPSLAGAAGSGAGRLARSLVELSKLHLSFYIALSALAGHVLAQDHVSRASLVLGGWVLMLACGSGVLNNIQDRAFDCLAPRTRHRLLARKAFSLNTAYLISMGFIGSALAGLYLSCPSVLPAILGMAAVVCYNGLYTPLKKRSLWAMVPGTVCGMIPPALGWTAVPAELASRDISGLIVLVVCLGVWQLPHRMLVDLKQPEPAEQAGGFSLIWPGRDLNCQILIWAVLFSLAVVLFLVLGWMGQAWTRGGALVVALSLPPALACALFYPASNNSGRPPLAELGFLAMNLSMFLFLALIVLDRL